MSGSNGVPKILIVDDEPDIVEYLCAVLEDNGYRTAGVTEAKEALEAVSREQPDLILMDILMPGESGLHLYREIRRNPETADIPVLIISGYTKAEDFAAVDLGMLEEEKLPLPDGYLEKPISIPKLIRSLNELFESHDVGEPHV
jgi:CheY-like chemotaxis protein